MRKEHHEEILEDMHSIGPEDFSRARPKRWLRWALGAFLILLMLLWFIPYYWIPVDPAPKPVARIDFSIKDAPPRLERIDDVLLLGTTQAIRDAALKITSKACPGNNVCYARALYNYVHDNINYISDPAREYIQSPEETLLGAGDCEDQAILLFMLLKSIGIRSRLVIVPGHAYIQSFLPEASASDKDGWVSMDPVCAPCRFGEVAPFNNDRIIRYIP